MKLERLWSVGDSLRRDVFDFLIFTNLIDVLIALQWKHKHLLNMSTPLGTPSPPLDPH